MTEKALSMYGYFPSYGDWKRFLKLQDPNQVDLSKVVDWSHSHYPTTFVTPLGVRNEISFANHIETPTLFRYPYLITQKYKKEGSHSVHLNIQPQSLSCDVYIETPDNPAVKTVGIHTTASIHNDKKWHTGQYFWLDLSESYWSKLKKSKLVAKETYNVRLSRSDKVWSADVWRNSRENWDVSVDLVSMMCQDAGFRFTIDDKRGLVTGSISGREFLIQQARPRILNGDLIWNCLTGQQENNPYIFQVLVR